MLFHINLKFNLIGFKLHFYQCEIGEGSYVLIVLKYIWLYIQIGFRKEEIYIIPFFNTAHQFETVFLNKC